MKIKLGAEFWFYAIGLVIINLGCYAVKKTYDKLEAQKAKVITIKVTPRSLTPVEAYVKRFSKVAQTEQKKYGIPASITLAQGILESGVGKSKLASKHNNHFGIKCWCRGSDADCVPFADDSRTDRFKKYSTAWMSYRHHSQFVSRMRLKLKPDANYKQWAKALKRAGYATKRTYAEDLIATIERYDLDRFDR